MILLLTSSIGPTAIYSLARRVATESNISSFNFSERHPRAQPSFERVDLEG